MNKLKYLVVSLAGATTLIAGGMGVASAASTHKNTNVGNSGIPRSVFKVEKLTAKAEVLNTSTANVQAAHQNKSFKTMLSNAGLTKAEFNQKVNQQVTSDLEKLGYTDQQISAALNHGKKHHQNN